jgi:hypothetical protein
VKTQDNKNHDGRNDDRSEIYKIVFIVVVVILITLSAFLALHLFLFAIAIFVISVGLFWFQILVLYHDENTKVSSASSFVFVTEFLLLSGFYPLVKDLLPIVLALFIAVIVLELVFSTIAVLAWRKYHEPLKAHIAVSIVVMFVPLAYAVIIRNF